MRPNSLIVRAYLARAFRVWLVARGIATIVFVRAGIDPVRLPIVSIAEIVLLSIALCFFDTYRRRERALLGNLAIGPGNLAAMFAVPAILGELAIQLVVVGPA
ncbi:MAG TPA: hypothetical protein VGI97_02610 [Gemmatimonadaceae bacterium]|jgi:predicted exporter